MILDLNLGKITLGVILTLIVFPNCKTQAKDIHSSRKQMEESKLILSVEIAPQKKAYIIGDRGAKRGTLVN